MRAGADRKGAMGLNDDIRILSGAGLLEDLSAEQIRLLAFGAERLRLPAGATLYHAGERADGGFVVVSGRIALVMREGDQEARLGRASAGMMLGELALIADTARLTSAVAETEAELLKITRVQFRRILEEYPDVAAKLHQRIADGLQDLMQRISRLAPRFS